MRKRVKYISYGFKAGETGQSLILVLILLVIGSLTLLPVMSHISTAVKSGKVYEEKTNELYAADAGIEDAIWQIKHDGLEALFESQSYAYDFSSNCSYLLEDQLNGVTTNVTIQNVWIPTNASPPSDPAVAKTIMESNKLMVSGTASANPEDSSYKIMIDFYPDREQGEEDELMVSSVGLWLPLDFTYDTGSGTLENLGMGHPCHAIPVVEPYAGGQSIVWTMASSANLTLFPDVDIGATPMYAEITCNYTAREPGTKPTGISWITTSGAVSDILDVTWDIDTKMYKITSEAADTEIQAHASRCELRQMGEAFSGDYEAFGNSLMTDDDPDWYDIRDHLHADSTATVDNISSSAEVIRAFLYWSGWREDFYLDDCHDFDDWVEVDDWEVEGGFFDKYFAGHHDGGEADRYLTMERDPLDLSPYTSYEVKVKWEQWVGGGPDASDALIFNLSGDGGTSWSANITAFEGDIGGDINKFSYTVPGTYVTDNFTMRFYLNGFEDSGEYCYLDDIAVTPLQPDTSVTLEINSHLETIAAQESYTLVNFPGYSYACNAEVTSLVDTYSTDSTGNGIYTVGGVLANEDNLLSYAGWSMIIIYFSPETAGHYLYLRDNFAYCSGEGDNLDFDDDGEPGGDITDFIIPEPLEGEPTTATAATLTCFVGEGDSCWTGDFVALNAPEEYRDDPWNIPDQYKLWDGDGSLDDVWDSDSVDITYDGVDIDTFEVTWGDDLVEPGDTTAHLDMYSPEDHWNLIYIILSLRSEIITGSTVHYVISSD